MTTLEEVFLYLEKEEEENEDDSSSGSPASTTPILTNGSRHSGFNSSGNYDILHRGSLNNPKTFIEHFSSSSNILKYIT